VLLTAVLRLLLTAVLLLLLTVLLANSRWVVNSLEVSSICVIVKASLAVTTILVPAWAFTEFMVRTRKSSQVSTKPLPCRLVPVNSRQQA
jgi:hypothetical protein